MNNVMIVMALPMEGKDFFKDVDVVYTGVGKVNAAYQLTKAISKRKPDIVINLGSAGSHIYETGTVVCCEKFIQRDMNATPLGFSQFQTPFEDSITINHGKKLMVYPFAICGTGDSFDINANSSDFDISDMEAYALAKICKSESLTFICVKFISDGANHRSHEEWEPALLDGSAKLRKAYDIIMSKLE